MCVNCSYSNIRDFSKLGDSINRYKYKHKYIYHIYYIEGLEKICNRSENINIYIYIIINFELCFYLTY